MGIDINWLAVIIGGAAVMVLGYLWYGPIFGKAWAKMVGLNEADMKKTATGPLVSAIILSFVTSYAVAYFMNFVTYDYSYLNGLRLALELSVGVLLPAILTITIFQRKPWTLFFVDWGYRLVGLALAGLIIGGMGI